jgi:hypothetical protein
VRRLLVLAALTAGTVLLTAVPASAHTVSGGGSTNFRSDLLSVTPGIAGLDVRVVENGRRMQLVNTGPVDVIVLGYGGEPYLRVGPAGVFENRRSPAVSANTPTGTVPPPATAAGPPGPPSWHRLSSGHTVRWHDHRTHWSGVVPTLLVRHAPPTGVVVREWTLHLVVGTQPVVVRGTLTWVPGPTPWPWAAAALVLVVGCVLAGRSRRWAGLLAAAAALLVAADVIHAVGTGLAVAGSAFQQAVMVLATGYYSIVAWVLGVIAVRLLVRRNIDGLFAATFAALVITAFGGFADATTLARSQVPFGLPVVLARAAVTVAIGAGLGLALGSVVAFRRNRTDAPEPS